MSEGRVSQELSLEDVENVWTDIKKILDPFKEI